MEQHRVEQRYRKRIPCRLGVAGSDFTGMVLNLSRTGLFVQTSATARPGDEIRLDLMIPSQPESIELAGKIVWKRIVAAHLRSFTQGGVGRPNPMLGRKESDS